MKKASAPASGTGNNIEQKEEVEIIASSALSKEATTDTKEETASMTGSVHATMSINTDALGS